MRLKLHEVGDGDKVALLVHSIISSSDTWSRVAPRLADRGYRVIMPDLRGHGESPQADSYSPELLAADLVESLPAGADLAIGHSFGASVLSLAVEGLRPAKVVYSDPAWRFTEKAVAEIREFAQFTKVATAEAIRPMFPRWQPEDIEAELAGYARWDVRAVDWLESSHSYVPDRPVVPSLVQGAGDHHLVPDELAETLRASGFEVRYVPDTGHCIHRDDLDGFLASLEGWI
ncbi:alpha/beta fold hydrolase [Kitasatospora sp. NPDC086009]|uniref:alpha/beta fold hydrolase n=1 Tax=unclassified Kitasatospora TaxID=2633591 RepID=UPI0033D8C533